MIPPVKESHSFFQSWSHESTAVSPRWTCRRWSGAGSVVPSPLREWMDVCSSFLISLASLPRLLPPDKGGTLLLHRGILRQDPGARMPPTENHAKRRTATVPPKAGTGGLVWLMTPRSRGARAASGHLLLALKERGRPLPQEPRAWLLWTTFLRPLLGRESACSFRRSA